MACGSVDAWLMAGAARPSLCEVIANRHRPPADSTCRVYVGSTIQACDKG